MAPRLRSDGCVSCPSSFPLHRGIGYRRKRLQVPPQIRHRPQRYEPSCTPDRPISRTPTAARDDARLRVRCEKEIDMDRASLPFLLTASPIVREKLGRDLNKVAVLAIQAMLRQRKGVEVALQQ